MFANRSLVDRTVLAIRDENAVASSKTPSAANKKTPGRRALGDISNRKKALIDRSSVNKKHVANKTIQKPPSQSVKRRVDFDLPKPTKPEDDIEDIELPAGRTWKQQRELDVEESLEVSLDLANEFPQFWQNFYEERAQNQRKYEQELLEKSNKEWDAKIESLFDDNEDLAPLEDLLADEDSLQLSVGLSDDDVIFDISF